MLILITLVQDLRNLLASHILFGVSVMYKYYKFYRCRNIEENEYYYIDEFAYNAISQFIAAVETRDPDKIYDTLVKIINEVEHGYGVVLNIIRDAMKYGLSTVCKDEDEYENNIKKTVKEDWELMREALGFDGSIDTSDPDYRLVELLEYEYENRTVEYNTP